MAGAERWGGKERVEGVELVEGGGLSAGWEWLVYYCYCGE